MNMNNKEKKRYLNKLKKANLKFNLSCRMSVDIRTSLKGNKNGLHWENLVGYNVEKLKRHLSKNMPKGYCWKDYLEGRLHLDHITPMSTFDYTRTEQLNFKRCWSLDNLQLLPAKENIIKSNKLSKPFQLVLAI